MAINWTEAEIEEVMTKQMRAERERRQTVLEAQAHQESVVSRAEGDKKRRNIQRNFLLYAASGRYKRRRSTNENCKRSV